MNHIQEYFNAACEAYRIGNIETAYNAPIMTLQKCHFSEGKI